MKNSFCLSKYFSIAESEHLQSLSNQIFVPSLIFLAPFFCIMLSAVEFYDQLSLRTIEINDVLAYGLLPVELMTVKLLAPNA